jgi:O-acetyl-ADP-ribose deacetylase (regulator of RNase III)
MNNVEFILCDPKIDMCNEWDRAIRESKIESGNFKIYNGKLQTCPYKFDCIVSPANSFGKMDGAFDLAISTMFSPRDIDKSINHVQNFLYKKFNGYQIIGTSIVIPMQKFNINCKWLLHVPTMKQPCNMFWYKDIVYNCMFSLLNSIHQHNMQYPDHKIQTVFLTGLATGIGRIPTAVAASQMILAYKHFKFNLEKREKTTSWKEITSFGLDIDEINRVESFF